MVGRMTRTIALLVAAVLVTGCATDHIVTLRNNTGAPLTYCPVVTDPPPPHREVSNTIIDPGLRTEIDVDGFNPLYWDPGSNLSVLVQLALTDDPPMLLAVILQHQVPPGQEGNDPALQPVKQAEYPYVVDTAGDEMNVVIRAGAIASGIPVTFDEN